MNIPINEELKTICSQIFEKGLTLAQWAEIESDDMFQTKTFEGGFDATEKEFVFAHFAEKEYWFQLSIEQVSDINKGSVMKIIARLADD